MQEPVPDLLKRRADLLLAQKIKKADPPTVRSQRGGRLQSVQVHANLKHDHNPFYLHARAHTGRADPREAMPCHAMLCHAVPCDAMLRRDETPCRKEVAIRKRLGHKTRSHASCDLAAGRGLQPPRVAKHCTGARPRRYDCSASQPPHGSVGAVAAHSLTVGRITGSWPLAVRLSTNPPCIDCRYSPCLPCSLDRAASAHAMESNM